MVYRRLMSFESRASHQSLASASKRRSGQYDIDGISHVGPKTVDAYRSLSFSKNRQFSLPSSFSRTRTRTNCLEGTTIDTHHHWHLKHNRLTGAESATASMTHSIDSSFCFTPATAKSLKSWWTYTSTLEEHFGDIVSKVTRLTPC